MSLVYFIVSLFNCMLCWSPAPGHLCDIYCNSMARYMCWQCR